MWWLPGLIAIAMLLHVFFRPNYVKTLKKIPGPLQIPYFGSLPVIISTSDNYLSNLIGLMNEYAPILRIQVLGTYQVILSDVNDVEKLLGSKTQIAKTTGSSRQEPWLGTSIFKRLKEKQPDSRMKLKPYFEIEIFEQSIKMLSKKAKALVDVIKTSEGQDVAINPLASLCTIDIIFETAMGIKVNAQYGEENEYAKVVLEMSKFYQTGQFNLFKLQDNMAAFTSNGRQQTKTFNILQGLTNKIIDEQTAVFRDFKNMKKRENSENASGVERRHSLIDLLIEIAEVEEEFPKDRIQKEVSSFIFSAYNAMAGALIWALFELGLNPHVQTLAQEELDSIFCGDDRQVTISDVAQMKYLERVVKETLRLYPSVPILATTLSEDTTFNGYQVPAGTSAAAFVYYIHRDPQLYTSPDKFDPDRFLPEQFLKRHSYSYVPVGSRNCIDEKFALLEAKVVLCELLRRYTVKSVTRREDIKLLTEVTLRPNEDILLQFAPRKY